jgi:hypothetical protein
VRSWRRCTPRGKISAHPDDLIRLYPGRPAAGNLEWSQFQRTKRQGTGVIGGMLFATVLAVFFVPMFFVAVLRWVRVRPRSADETPAASLPLPLGES